MLNPRRKIVTNVASYAEKVGEQGEKRKRKKYMKGSFATIGQMVVHWIQVFQQPTQRYQQYHQV